MYEFFITALFDITYNLLGTDCKYYQTNTVMFECSYYVLHLKSMLFQC